jgi:nicotinamidase-related amidase
MLVASMPSARDWSSFALVLVDVQQGFWWPSLAEAMPAFPANVARLLAVCRQEGIAVVHLRLSFRADGSDWPPFEKLGAGINCLEGCASREPTDFARAWPGEAVIYKHALDGFVEPELHAHLRARGARFLLVAGLATSVCVLLTAVSATQRGYLTAVVEDCCADQPAAHDFALGHFDGYGFTRTRLADLTTVHARWMEWLERLAEPRQCRAHASPPPVA